MASEESARIAIDVRPKASEDQVKQMVTRQYGLKVSSIKTLVAYDDQNFYIRVDLDFKENSHISDFHSAGYVVKILNSDDSKYRKANIKAQMNMMDHLNERGITCPDTVKNKQGQLFSIECLASDYDGNTHTQEHILRLLKYIEGDVLDSYLPITANMSYEMGRFVGEFRLALEGYQDQDIERNDCQWNVLNVHWVRDYVKYVESEENRAAALRTLDLWDSIKPLIFQLEQVPVHNDINSTNTIVQRRTSTTTTDSANPPHIVGVIDFGEACLAPRIFDLAFCVMYMMTDAKDNYLRIGERTVQGYLEVMKITEEEKKVLYYVIIARFTLSLVYGAYYYSIHKDPYLLVTQTGWTPLKVLLAENPDELIENWTIEHD